MTIFRRTTAGRALRLSAAALALLPAGCVVGPKYRPPETPGLAPAYKEAAVPSPGTGSWKVASPADAKLRGKWWEMFGDPELNALEERLDIDNQNIKEYFENFMAARAIVREARSQYFPTLAIGPSITRSQASANAPASPTVGGGAVSGAQLQSTLYSLPLEASWAPDLWGKVRNTVRQAQYAAQLSAAELENERLTEQAALAEYFFQIRGQDQLQKILDDTVAADQKNYDLTRGLYDSGIDNQLSVVEAETTLRGAQAAASNVAIARAQYEHAIAVLVGKAASGFSIPVKPMIAAPPPIPVGVPSELLERRPDVAAAERAMAGANAAIGVADAAYYPTLTLSAEGGFASSSLGNWLSWPSRFWSIGPSVSETLYDAGLRRATVSQYTANYEADLAAYRQTVLAAFSQVEDALAEVRILSGEIQQERQAVSSARLFLTLEQGRCELGLDPYIDVLIAQTTVLADEQTLNGLEVQQMVSAMALVQALGGGWNRSELPTPDQVTQKPAKTQ
jgi:NodT family efflux transporter outer membrane factor (OMF) lipoprotein